MNLIRSCSLAAGALLCAALSVRGANDPDAGMEKIHWIKGPATAVMRDIAQVDVPEGFIFTDGGGTKRLMKAMGNVVSDQEEGFLSPTNMAWFVVFEFDPVGYVKDDDKDKLDADAMLDSIRRGTEYGNQERAKMGVPPMHIVGWEQPPHYNADTHNLEWAIRGESEGKPVLNYNTRLLGRKGYMRVTLVGDPEGMTTALPGFKSLLAAYTFQSGQTYGEYRSGDKVAKYGLAALITAGAAVGAAKLGLFAWLAVLLKKGAKLVVVAVVAIIAMIKKIFTRLFGGRGSSSTSTTST